MRQLRDQTGFLPRAPAVWWNSYNRRAQAPPISLVLFSSESDYTDEKTIGHFIAFRVLAQDRSPPVHCPPWGSIPVRSSVTPFPGGPEEEEGSVLFTFTPMKRDELPPSYEETQRQEKSKGCGMYGWAGRGGVYYCSPGVQKSRGRCAASHFLNIFFLLLTRS